MCEIPSEASQPRSLHGIGPHLNLATPRVAGVEAVGASGAAAPLVAAHQAKDHGVVTRRPLAHSDAMDTWHRVVQAHP
jgi:hypothetical protein